jgi:DNA-binding CsgD family transcriptional regulator
MGPSPIEIPEYFTIQWYRNQKECKKTDKEIANELLISIPLLAKWKKNIGWETNKIYKLMCGRKRILNPYEIQKLKDEGLSNVEIAERFDVTTQALWYCLKSTHGHVEGNIMMMQ